MNFILWFIVVCLVQSGAVVSFRASFLSFIGGGSWLRVPSQGAQRIISPLARKESIKNFCASNTLPLTTIDGFEGEDEAVESAPVIEMVWTPEKDTELLARLKRLKRLRWYKVAKLMGEGATARNCHDRWVELTEIKETPVEMETRQREDEALNVWSEYEVACLTTSVQRNIKEDSSIDWVRVGKELGLEGFVCEKKHNALLAEAAEAERAQLEAETAVLAEGEDFWSSQEDSDMDMDVEDAGDAEDVEQEQQEGEED